MPFALLTVVASFSPACAAVVTATRDSPSDAAVLDSGVALPDVTPDVATDDGAAQPDVAPEDVTAPPAAFAVRGGLGSTDGYLVNLTFFEDGSAYTGFSPEDPTVRESRRLRVAGGAAQIARLRSRFENDRLLEVPEGMYGPPPDFGPIPYDLAYVRDGRVYRWRVTTLDEDPAPVVRAITALIREGYGLSL